MGKGNKIDSNLSLEHTRLCAQIIIQLHKHTYINTTTTLMQLQSCRIWKTTRRSRRARKGTSNPGRRRRRRRSHRLSSMATGVEWGKRRRKLKARERGQKDTGAFLHLSSEEGEG
jgi:hypothetical protein